MAEYIEKRKVVNLLIELEKEFQQFKPFKGFEHAMYRKLCEAEIAIGKLPAADVAPVVHGCFEPCFDENGNWRQGFAKCSNCGKEYYAQVINHFDYCPNCGAKMDGESTEGDVEHGMGSKE